MISRSMVEWYSSVALNGEGAVLLDQTLLPRFTLNKWINQDIKGLNSISEIISDTDSESELDSKVFMASDSSIRGFYKTNSFIQEKSLEAIQKREAERLRQMIRARESFIQRVGTVENELDEEGLNNSINTTNRILEYSVKKGYSDLSALHNSAKEVSYALEMARQGDKVVLCTAYEPMLNLCRDVFGDPTSPAYQMFGEEEIGELMFMKVTREMGWKSHSVDYRKLRSDFDRFNLQQASGGN